MKIAILGGTGDEGRGLGLRWAMAGHEVLIGSRSAERGAQAAEEMNEELSHTGPTIRGGDNASMAREAEVVVLSVPYKAQQPTLEAVRDVIEGKLLVTVVVPLEPPKVSHVWQPEAGSAAQEAQDYLSDSARVVAAYQNISAELLPDPEQDVNCDVLICGDNKEDKDLVRDLTTDAGMRGIDAGPLQNAGVVEGLTAVLIGINIRNKIKHSGIRITGLPEDFR
ncbi:MAG TPA: NADPH-dependent F420 reductase [Candidatus Sulfomarinibacteraceae bacterium]|nr:NADPH-dependent F420 reductase [Candidatus Sulfomarinibacteraceae bacterium]